MLHEIYLAAWNSYQFLWNSSERQQSICDSRRDYTLEDLEELKVEELIYILNWKN